MDLPKENDQEVFSLSFTLKEPHCQIVSISLTKPKLLQMSFPLFTFFAGEEAL